MAAEAFTLFINGSYGVGKSMVLDHVGDVLAATDQPFSLLDVDWFHRSWPLRADDPDNVLIEALNIAAVWANYRTAGPRQLVIAGVIATPSDRDRYEHATGMPVRSVRLEATHATVEDRLRHRYQSERNEQLSWHLHRHRAVAQELCEADMDEAVIATDHSSPQEVARQVLQHVALL